MTIDESLYKALKCKTIHFYLREYAKNHSIYIETGLFHGTSLKQALFCDFDEVHSCDISKDYISAGEKEFKKEIEDKKVFLHYGRSTDVLKKILSTLDQPAVFFLDAHDLDYPGVDNSLWKEEDACPVLSELEVIGSHHIKNHVIMVDDLRMFEIDHYSEDSKFWPYKCEGRVNLARIYGKIYEINDNYVLIREHGAKGLDDILVAALPEELDLKKIQTKKLVGRE